MAPSVLIIGAGGAIGTPLVAEFIKQNSSFSRIAILLSDPSKKSKFGSAETSGIEFVTGSFLDKSSYEGFDTVVSTVGNAILKLQPAMIDQAIAAGVRQFYPSEYGADLSQRGAWGQRYFRSKLETRAHLARRAKEVKEFKYTLILNGFFTEASPFCVDKESKTAPVFGSLDASTSVASVRDVVNMIVASIPHPYSSGTQKRELRITGSRQTFKELIEKLGRAQGIEYTFTFPHSSVALEEQYKAWEQDDEDGEYGAALKGLPTSGVAHAGEGDDSAAFGIKPESAENTFKRMFGGQ